MANKGSYEIKGTFIIESGSTPINLFHEDCGGGKATAEYSELLPYRSQEMKDLTIGCQDCRFSLTILVNQEMRQELALVVKGKLEEAILGYGIISKKCIVFKKPA